MLDAMTIRSAARALVSAADTMSTWKTGAAIAESARHEVADQMTAGAMAIHSLGERSLTSYFSREAERVFEMAGKIGDGSAPFNPGITTALEGAQLLYSRLPYLR